jgi:mannan endo-1,4-beta-mannosidase
MRGARRLGGLVAAAALAAACRTHAGVPRATSAPRLVDARATPETRALFANLRRLAGTQVMFGQQDALAYGHDWVDEPGRSDVKDVTGAYPAVYGWDLAGLERDVPSQRDTAQLAKMRRWIVEGFGRGGVVTVSWHMSNPVTGGDAWDTTGALATILPGAPNHARYVRWLDRLAEFAGSVRAPAPNGGTTLVPLVFRPFHEMSGGWFWWGAAHTKPEELQALWRFTVEYLRDRKGVHNLLYAYSPDKLYDYGAARYYTWYPGDAYVDVLGIDQYYWPATTSWAPKDQVAALAEALRWVAGQASARGKIAALTETGFETVPDSTWWTGKLLRAIAADSLTRRIAYVMVWRNANRQRMGREHFYAPFLGHPSAADFVRFRADPLIAFGDELPALYRMPDGR